MTIPMWFMFLRCVPILNRFVTLFSLIWHRKKLPQYTSALIDATGISFRQLMPWPVRSAVVTACPADIEYALKTNFSNYPKGDAFREVFRDLLGRGIFNVDGDTWKLQRKKASLFFTKKNINTHMTNHFVSDARELVEQIKYHESGTLDAQDLFHKVVLKSFLKVAFNLQKSDLNFSLDRFCESFDEAQKLTTLRFIYPWWRLAKIFNLSSEMRLRNHIYVVQKGVKSLVWQANNCGKSHLMHHMQKAGQELDMTELTINLLVAGRDTTASTLTSCIRILAKCPKQQTSIYIALQRYVMIHKTFDWYSLLDDCREIRNFIYEVWRMYPPVPTDIKTCTIKDTLPSGCEIFPGERLVYSIYSMGRSEEVWGPSAKEFNPDRWIINDKRGKASFPVFNYGYRTCLGKKMAEVETAIFLVHLVSNFQMKLVRSSPDAYVNGPTLKYEGGVQVRFSLRTVPPPLKLDLKAVEFETDG